MKYLDPISTIMTSNVKTIDIKDSLYDAKSIMLRKKIRHLPVLNKTRLVGILSLTDIMRLSFGQVFVGQEDTDQAMMDMLNIEQIMREHPRTIDEKMTIQDAAEIFALEEFHALPVVGLKGLVGIVTTTDLIKYFIKD
jgi:signal-transduction protein with cAMP-binding, CBS, and nucleotidyltransferase domain